MVGVIAERETVVELTVRAVAEPETFGNLEKKTQGRNPLGIRIFFKKKKA